METQFIAEKRAGTGYNPQLVPIFIYNAVNNIKSKLFIFFQKYQTQLVQNNSCIQVEHILLLYNIILNREKRILMLQSSHRTTIKPRKGPNKLLTLLAGLLGFSYYKAAEVGITPLLTGVGYYEQVLQVGIDGASMAGGTEIVFYGQGMSHTPSSISAIFTNDNLGGSNQAGPPQPQDVAFSSHTDGGKLKYSTPSLMDLHRTSYEAFNTFDWITYDLSLVDYDSMTQQVKSLKCKLPSPDSYCRITVSRDYTPILYYLAPPVVYSGSPVAFWIDPRSAQRKKSTTLPEFPFVEVRLNEYGVDFEGFLEEDTVLPTYTKSQVRGIMGAITPNASAAVNFRFRVGYALHNLGTMLRCSYDNSTCYKAKALAVINSISASSGYTTGEQVITVNGHGFTSSNIKVLIDGVPCKVTYNDLHKFQCLTGPQPTPSNDTVYIGQHGLRRKFYNTTSSLDFQGLQASNDYTLSLAMDLEAPLNVKDGTSGNSYSGFFKAPATARHRFYISCDDACQIIFSTANKDPSQKKVIYTSNGYTSYRNYFTLDNRRTTPWLNLTKDEYYYIEVLHVQWSGGDHVSVAVEIEDLTAPNGHWHSMREIQRLIIGQELIRDKTNITITNPDGGSFILYYTNPLDNSVWTSPSLNTNMSAVDMSNALTQWYRNVWGSYISVAKYMYDANDTLVSDQSQSVKNVFTITVLKSLPQASVNIISPSKVSTKSTIQFAFPKVYQVSSLPLKGAFMIRCQLPDGTTNTTTEIGVYNSTNTIRDRIVQACPNYREKFEIKDGPQQSYYEDGRDIQLRFSNLNQDVPQFEILSCDANPLQGNNVYLNSTTWIPYSSQNIFYEPVPFEFLHTAETTPQVIVTVDDLPAACDSLNCGFTYVEPTSKITGFSWSASTLTLIGEIFPAKIKSISFSNIDCQDISVIDNQTITCTVIPVAGVWQPIVIDENGIIPVNTTDTIDIPLTVTAVSPSSNLNPFGGSTLEITGENLPHSLIERSEVSITFGDGTHCLIESVSPTKIVCVTEEFATSFFNTLAMTININGKSDSSLSVSLSGAPAQVSAVVPNQVSPVLKSIIKMTVTNYGGTLDKEDLIVAFVSQTNSSIVRYANIIETGNEDNGDQYLKVKFGGSESGIYDIKVRSKSFGRFETSGQTLQTIGTVTSFEPKQGSVHGGTLITINGYWFSNDFQDNPVRIGYTDCMVEQSTPTEIKCRTLPFMDDADATEDLIVFLKTYEEAVCASCSFQWVKTGLAALTDYQVVFDTTLNEYILTLTGTNFGATTDNTEVYIDDIKQPILSASDTEVEVKITNILSSSTLNIKFYLPIGIPDGTDNLTYATGITLQPQFLSLTPNIGSPGGSLITAVVKGIGNMTTGVTLVNQAGEDICQSVTIPSYGVVVCQTKAVVVSDQALQVKVGQALSLCLGTNNECNYQTIASMPTVSSVTKVDATTLTLTGSGYLMNGVSGYEAKVSYVGVFADTVTVDSDTQVTAMFNNGIPIAQTAIKPSLSFTIANPSQTHWASVNAMISNPLEVTSTDGALECSFAGGCKLKINQPGLLQNLQSDTSKNAIRVCGQVCAHLVNDSTPTSFTCTIPPLATTYSIDQYKIISESYLKGTPFSSNSALTMSVFDGSHQNGWSSTASNCYFGTAFRAGYIGELNEVKYYMSRFTKSNFVGKLKFQGSMTGTTWTDIFVVGQEIHEGWNYYNYQAGQELKYRYYRFFGTGTGSCIVGEISFRGYEVIDNNDPTYICQAQVYLNGTSVATLTGDITYRSEKTPLLKSISPRFGSVVGGETVTFEGENFSSDVNAYSIAIDGKLCTVTEASDTFVKCITAKRPGLQVQTTLEISINGKGKVATQGLLYRYGNLWSDPITWGGEFAPIEGDMVYVPKGLNLLVDVDSTPILSAVVVEGSLIFPSHPDPEHHRTFDAHYVLVRGGYFEIGTENFPYTSKLTITMHSKRSDPELPVFGNKVIAMYNGVLDIHGIPREPTWTMLETTSEAGSSTITLMRAVDWKVGERIVIAPTDYENYHAEEKAIVAIDRSNPDKPVITLDTPLEYKHFAGIQHFGDDFIEMRAEVGLLTRNIKYQGDPETSAKNEYGAHLMVHSNGDETLLARIAYAEFYNVGQAFQLGRYPIHFHLIGAVHHSYIRGNAIHQSYNRACTIHGVHYLRLISNVAYDIKGHTYFIEDAAETKNLLENNLAILTKKSWSLLNSDQTPASFWITHPDNILRGNHAAGSDNYGYWFDTKPNPTGPSFDPNICPENSPLGEFSNNVAHSNGRYGLRVFHKLIPRTFPCQAIVDDPNNTTDPYWKNPLITARFQNFTSFKNKRNGAIALDVGDVRFENFKVSDNILAGIEFELTKNVRDGYAQVNGALVIGRSDNAEELTNTSPSHGIIGPRTENFQIHNVKFYNFDIAGKAALGSCSHCFSAPSTDSGARTVTLSGLYFDPATVLIKIRYEIPFRDIFYDLDGTLTGLGPKTWTTPYWKHNEQLGCTRKQYEYDGLVCDSSVEVRRVVFYNYNPNIFDLMDMKVLPYDDSVIKAMDNVTLQAYICNKDNYSIVPWREKLDPKNAWAIPVVTGHKYKIHWQYGLDWTQMQMDLSPKWNTTDQSIYFIMNFTDVRAKIDFLTGGDNIQNMTLLSSDNAVLQTGANVVYNETAKREIHFLVNGKNSTRKNIVMKGYRCIGPCLSAVNNVAIESNVRLWSNAQSWPSGKVPLAGEDIVIEAGKNYVFDLEESPIYNYIQINGRVTFLEDANKLHLQAKYIFVRAGELIIGNKTHPFKGQAQITLHGEKANEQIVYDNAIEAGNKILVNTGLMQMYGVSRSGGARTRLLKTANPGDTQILVEPGLGWQVNDTIGLAPTAMIWQESDYAVVKSYDNSTGAVTLDRKLDYYHWGASVSTAANYSGVDMRGEVILLNRNIRIVGNDSEAWGCQVLTSDFIEGNGLFRNGRTMLDNVEIYNCSQYDTYKAAVRFEGSLGSYSVISNSSIHHGLGIGIETQNAANLLFVNNSVFDFKKYGINIEGSTNVTVDGNWVFNIRSRKLRVSMEGDEMGAILGCANNPSDKCFGLKIVNNNVAGVQSGGVDSTGYSVYGNDCGDTTNIVFKDNTAHSIQGYGAIIFKNASSEAQLDCIEASYFTAYKCTVAGIVSNQATNGISFQNMVLIDNAFSASANIGQEGVDQFAKMKNIKFYGETEARDCKVENICEDEQTRPWYCVTRTAVMPSNYANHHKPALIISSPAWPQYKIKADASFGGKTQYENLSFINFKSAKTWCGSDQRLFALNRFAADYIPATRLYNTRFENVDQDAMAYLFTPPNEWSVVDDCGEFPCTGPLNALIQFERSTFAGAIQPMRTDSDFQIIANNVENSGGFSNCRQVLAWNGYYCTNPNLAVIAFESLDEDRFKRILSPITITSMNLTSRNVINTFMDHLWDGFYTSMLRLSRFVAIVQGGPGMVYEINYKSTPPQKQTFAMKADYTSVVLRIKYSKPGTYIIKDSKSGKEIRANAWDNNIQAPAVIKGDRGGYCGENRYLGVVNVLEFYLSRNCNITIEPIDSIQTSVRLNWTLNEFFKDGGTTKFVDRVAASLGIKPANIKVVSVYQGSVFVDFQLIDDPETKAVSGAGGLDKVQAALTEKLTTGQVDLGAPILSVSVTNIKATASVVTDKPETTTTIPVVVNNPTTTPDNTQTQQPGTTPTVQPKPKPTPPPPSPPPVIYHNNTIVVVHTQQESGSGDNTLMIATIVSIVGLITIGGGAGFFLYKKFSRHSLPSQHHHEESPKKNASIDQSSKEVSASKQHLAGDEMYETQYHPRPEIDIFAKDDPFKKVNEADSVYGEEEDERSSNAAPEGKGVLSSDGEMVTRQRESAMKEDIPLQGMLSNQPVECEIHIRQGQHSNRQRATTNLHDEEWGVKQPEVL